MKISAQEEYGLRCLLQLAQSPAGSGLTVKEIALREGLSSAYVEKLLRLLGKAGLIHSVRGTKGGYLLNRRPQEISLASVVEALGKVPTPGEICGRFTGNRAECIHVGDCGIRSAWETLTSALSGFLARTCLSDLVGAEAQARHTMEQRMGSTPWRPAHSADIQPIHMNVRKEER